MLGDLVLADILLAERGGDLFAPLFRWRGDMPPAILHRVGSSQVLVVVKDFGGNVPIVGTWAWVWSPAGPIRLDAEGALRKAIQRVAPGHVGYDTGIQWETLHCMTWSWPEGH
jgi:hypothetical protein